MRHFVILTMIATLGAVNPLVAAEITEGQAPLQSEAAVVNEPMDPIYPLVLTAGALAGVIGVNWLTYGVGTLPLTTGIQTAAPIVSPAAAAASRIFVITSAVLGSWVADMLYH